MPVGVLEANRLKDFCGHVALLGFGFLEAEDVRRMRDQVHIQALG
jgi:hypothetical protein